MNLYQLVSPENYYYAQASFRGTWYSKTGKLCPECGTSDAKRISPLIMEWDAGSDIIGDFVWPRLNCDVVVVQKVRDTLESQFRGFMFGPVELWQTPKLQRPTRMTRRSKPRVWLPYEGPQLWDLLPLSWIHLDHAQSDISVEKTCSTCGRIFYNLPLRDHRHLVLDTATWNAEDIFHIYEYPGVIYCIERVKEFVEQAGFTNVSFREEGIIPE